MVGDLQLLSDAFISVMPAFRDVLAKHAAEAAEQWHAADQLQGCLQTDASSAVSIVKDGFRGLMYVVLLSSVHKHDGAN